MKNFAIVGLRLLAIWVFLQALFYAQHLSSLFLLDQQELNRTLGYSSLVMLFIYVAGAIFLYGKASSIASNITKDTEETDISVNNYNKLAAVLYATAGLLIMIWSLESLFGSVNRIYHSGNINPQLTDSFFQVILQLLLGGGIQMILGLYLFVGSERIADWWYGFRNWT